MDKNDFAVRQPVMIGEGENKKYAVLVPLVDTPDGPALLFEKRAASLRRQPGEICFPGGMIEPGETPAQCACRETAEELSITPDQITLFGPGDTFISPFNFIIYTFIGKISDYGYTHNTAEVAEVIAVPLSFFTKEHPEQYISTLVNQPPDDFPYERIPGGDQYPWASGTQDILLYQYGAYLIWGITARLAHSAVGLIEQYHLS